MPTTASIYTWMTTSSSTTSTAGTIWGNDWETGTGSYGCTTSTTTNTIYRTADNIFISNFQQPMVEMPEWVTPYVPSKHNSRRVRRLSRQEREAAERAERERIDQQREALERQRAVQDRARGY